MSSILSVVEGWTGAVGPFTLKLNDEPVDLTGLTITPVLRSTGGTLVATAGTVTPDPDQVTNKGQLTYYPAAGDFVYDGVTRALCTRYKLHWKSVDGSGKITFFPNDAAVDVDVYRA